MKKMSQPSLREFISEGNDYTTCTDSIFFIAMKGIIYVYLILYS